MHDNILLSTNGNLLTSRTAGQRVYLGITHCASRTLDRDERYVRWFELRGGKGGELENNLRET
jgi:hypothetical protein